MNVLREGKIYAHMHISWRYSSISHCVLGSHSTVNEPRWVIDVTCLPTDEQSHCVVRLSNHAAQFKAVAILALRLRFNHYPTRMRISCGDKCHARPLSCLRDLIRNLTLGSYFEFFGAQLMNSHLSSSIIIQIFHFQQEMAFRQGTAPFKEASVKFCDLSQTFGLG